MKWTADVQLFTPAFRMLQPLLGRGGQNLSQSQRITTVKAMNHCQNSMLVKGLKTGSQVLWMQTLCPNLQPYTHFWKLLKVPGKKMDVETGDKIQFWEMKIEREMPKQKQNARKEGTCLRNHLLRKSSLLTSAAGLEKRHFLCALLC